MVLFFYIFATLLITGSLGVILAKNPVHSVLWLIFAFCNAAGLFILLGAEFLAMTLIVVYVGAVAVLFLFVVMMLDINIAEIRSNIAANWPLVLFFLCLFSASFIIIIMSGMKTSGISANALHLNNSNNTLAIGSVVYTQYILPFQISGLVLLVAMIGCIAITLRYLPGVRRQDMCEQLLHNKENSLKVKSVKTNTGVKNIKYD